MSFKTADRVKQTSSTPGTGNLTLDSGIPAGYQSLASAGYAVGDTFDAVIVASNGSGWECSLCTLVDATHIARLKVYSSSNSGNLVNFTSVQKTISVDLPAAKVNVLSSFAYTNGTYF